MIVYHSSQFQFKNKDVLYTFKKIKKLLLNLGFLVLVFFLLLMMIW